MPHISKRKIAPEIDKQIKASLVLLIKDLNNVPDTEKFLSSIMSATERVMIAKRVVAAFLLRHNVESKKIEDLLKLTPETICRLKLRIQINKDSFDAVFEKLERQRRSEVLKDILYRFLSYAISASSGRVPNPFKRKIGEA